MTSRGAWLGWLALVGLAPSVVLAPSAALAQAPAPPPPAEGGQIYSSYEQATIDEVLTSLHETLDPAPEGKIVDHVTVVPLDVIEPRDPLPLWVNLLHATSRESVIRRELLVREGQRYQQVLVDDSIRNLRRLPQVSAILVVATRTADPDRAGVVIITKDVWSLRLNWDILLTAGGLDRFEALPAEWNFLGTHQTLTGHFVYEPSALTFGAGYTAPRIGSSRVALDAAVDVMVNRQTGRPEGSLGSLVAGEPLYSPQTEWAWDASAAWVDEIVRFYSNGRVKVLLDPATNRTVRDEYRERRYLTTYELTRSFGWEAKHDVTLAASIDRREFRPDAAGVDPTTEADFVASRVPRSDTRVGPSIQYHTYSKRYLRVIDFDSLALQEDFRLGHDVVFRFYPSFAALGGSRDVYGLYGALEYTFGIRDGLFRVSFQSTTEPEAERIADAALQPTVHLVSPTIAGLGRLVLDATLLYRWRNYLKRTTLLGGGDRLRGFPPNFFQGASLVANNLEFRTRPVEILSCQIGAVAFFDAGDAWNGPGDFAVHQAAGVGLRALFPQLDRLVFRADLGFPFDRPLDPATGTHLGPYALIVSFEQAFPTPSVSPTPVLPTGQQ
ncbi:MAG: hypothetical protein JOZ69_07710 [Myxococcales bacterium]|nr:hypothetical protein [Myxococcales bacterium]